MFNSFKFNGPVRTNSDTSVNEKSAVRPSHVVATEMSDDDYKSDSDVKEGPSTNSTVPDKARERQSFDHTGSPRRTFASVMNDIFRRTSETSTTKNGSDPPSRKHSQQTEVSRARAAATALGLFQSHNPDVDSEEAAAVNSPFPRKGSVVSNHSGEDVPGGSQDPPPRRPSYMPRNATASFLKTATGKSEPKPEEEEEKSGPRKPSVMGSVMGVGPGGETAAGERGAGAGRRPSGMTPNNVASRYVRSASQGANDQRDDKNDSSSRRRSSARPRQMSNNPNGNNDTQIRAVQMGSDQFQQWQNSVQRNGSRVSFSPAITRQRSVDNVTEDVEGEEQEAASTPATSRRSQTSNVKIAVQQPTPEKKTQTPQGMRQNKPMSAFMADQGSPNTVNLPSLTDFGPSLAADDMSEITEIESRPETPLESLGFKGAVPA